MPTKSTPVDAVAAVLENYASRGVFRGFSRKSNAFKMIWHRDRPFDLTVDAGRGTIRIPVVLPSVPKEMYQDLREFIASRHTEEVPEHRRVDLDKAELKCATRNGDVSLTITAKDRDFEYAARKLINIVQEVYLGFLTDGPYYEYQIETFDLDPDQI